MMSNTTTTNNNNNNNDDDNDDNVQKHYYEQRLSLAVSLILGGQLLSKNNFEEAKDAFESAYRFLSLTPSVAMTTSGNFVNRKTKQEQEMLCVQHEDDDIISSSLPSSSSTSSSSSSSVSTTQEQQHIDTYREDECDVGPRTFNDAIVPDDVMGLDIDVLHLIISYNQALVFHRSKNYVLASQLYKFITCTVATYLSTTGTTHATLSHLAMRAHNNMGQIEYIERSEECAHSEFDNALAYVRGHHHQQATAPIISVAAVIANTTTPDHQLEIASVLSNWCRTRWMLGRVDDNVYTALEDILRIRSSHMDENHPDIAVAHFNLGRAEFSRQSNSNALKHFLHYMRISSHRFQEKNSTTTKNNNTNNNKEDGVGNVEVDFELDPIQGLIYVLQIQNDEKDDEMSQDLIWGLRTLQEKRTELGPIHTEVASVLNYIGTLLFRRLELDYALCFFAQELRVEERLRVQAGKKLMSSSSPPKDDVSISVTCNNIGRILQELGRYPEAKYYYQRSLGNNEGDDDDNNNDTSANNCTISENSSKTGQRNQKSAVRENVINEDGVDNNNDDDDNTSDVPSAAMNLYSTVWYNLGLIHDKMGAFKEAIRAFRMSLKLRRAMLGHEHSDVSCLLYNIGVLQMEQNLLEEASESFREAFAHRHVAGKGQLNDHHVIKTLQKLSSLHKSKGNLNGALQANRDILSVLTTSTDFKHATRNRKIAIVMRNIADLYQAQGNLQVALEHATNSANLFRLLRTTPVEDQKMEDDMDVDNTEDDDEDEKNNKSSIEEETNALLLVGSLQHEQCDPLSAQVAFSETVRLVHSTLSTSAKFASTLLPLLEVSAMLALAHCAAEA
jgi:tetratricopeptide (TPR) repeat protein